MSNPRSFPPPAQASPSSGRRWRVAAMGAFLQLCLGTVYAWSYFQKPVVAAFGCSQSAAAWAFSLAICCLGLAAAWGGRNLARFGPTRLAVAGVLLYGGGWLLAGWAVHQGALWLFHIGFGVVGGAGLGLGYVTPVATVARWFPDRKGLVTGMVVMGFGLGAVAMSMVLAPALMRWWEGDLGRVFFSIGVALLAASLPAALTLKNPPPDDFAPAGSSREPGVGWPEPALPVARLAQVWVLFFCNICAGIMFIGFQSPMLQDLLKARRPELDPAALAAAGAVLIALSSLFNGLGRLLWGGCSDRLGRVRTFRLILGTQVAVFGVLPWVASPWLFGILVCYVLLCYGGGFGTVPSLVMDLFGAQRMAVVYGGMLTAWSAAGIAGPQWVAWLKDRAGAQAAGWTFGIGAVLLAIGFAVSLTLRPEPGRMKPG